MSDNKKCPFCNGEVDPDGWLGNEGKTRGPECSDCGATAASIDDWNTRAPQAADSDITKDLTEAIEEISPARFTGLVQTTALIAHEVVISLLERSRSALLAPQAASGDARCKFCEQLPNMEGDCRCDLDPAQAYISETVKLVDELIEEAIKEGGTLGVRWETLKIIKAGIEPSTDSVTISRECAEFHLDRAIISKERCSYPNGVSEWDERIKELKQALEANPMQVTGGLCE
jgi:hypothetical protein